MKRNQIYTTLLSLLALCFVCESYGAPKEKEPKNGTAEAPLVVKVASLKEIQPYLRKDYVHLTMEPGVYRITAKEATGAVKRSGDVVEDRISYSLLLLEGNNNTFDFTGVTFEVETAVANAFPGSYSAFNEIHMIGSDNVIKGLTIKNVGMRTDAPRNGWVNAVIDGARNTLEDVEIHSQGSRPYGYGSLFGIGGKAVIGHKKHSVCLIRGDDVMVRGCRFIHRAFGHFIFMQGSHNVTIEGCYLEGAMSTTDAVLAEKGTKSAADKVGFMTYFGYVTPPGYTIPLSEDGIRTYASGSTMIDGKRYVNRTTSGVITVKDCTVKHARRGVGLIFGSAKAIVENCTLIGCQSGYSVNNGGQIINCRADAAFGPAVWISYNNVKGVNADVTLIPYEGEPYAGNKSGQAAIIIGNNNKVTLRKGEGFVADEKWGIYVGGNCLNLGQLDKDQNSPAKGCTLINETGMPIFIDDNTSGNKITTSSEVTDDGTNNIITKK